MLKLARARTNRAALAPQGDGSDLTGRTAHGSAVAISAQLARVVVQFLALAGLARLLTPADFGLVAMANAVTALSAVFIEPGVTLTTVQRRELDQTASNILFYASAAIGLVCMALLVALAPLAGWFFADDRVAGLVIALAASIPVVAAGRQHAAILRRTMRWKPLELSSLVGQAAGAVCALACAWFFHSGYMALVVQVWVAAVVTAGLLWWWCPWRPTLGFKGQAPGAVLGFGASFTLSQFLSYLQRQIDDILIGWRWGAAPLGFYNRAYLLLAIPTQLITAPFNATIVPALSRVQAEPERWRRIYLEALGLTAIVSSGITAILIACSDAVILITFGSHWDQSREIFLTLSVSLFSLNLLATVNWIYVSLGRGKSLMVWSIVSTLALLLGFALAIAGGPLAMARAYSGTMLLLFLPGMFLASRASPVSFAQVLRQVAFPLGAGIASALFGRFLHGQLDLFAPVVSGVLVGLATATLYGVATVMIWRLDPCFDPVRQRTRRVMQDVLLRRKAGQAAKIRLNLAKFARSGPARHRDDDGVGERH